MVPDISEIEIPRNIPIMTLPEAVLFPQVMMPLHIFEQRYRTMLSDVLHGSRVFGIATLRADQSEDPSVSEPFHSVGSVGIVRASQSNDDGTSNVLLQGLMRVRFEEVLQEDPYRIVSIDPLQSTTTEAAPYTSLQGYILELLAEKRQHGSGIPDEVMSFLEKIQDPESFIEFASHSACEDSIEKVSLLEETETLDRFNLLTDFLIRDVERMRLFHKLQNGLEDDRIGLN